MKFYECEEVLAAEECRYAKHALQYAECVFENMSENEL
jgi:hypothetical protein